MRSNEIIYVKNTRRYTVEPRTFLLRDELSPPLSTLTNERMTSELT